MTVLRRRGDEILVAGDPLGAEMRPMVAARAGGGFVTAYAADAPGADSDGGQTALLRLHRADGAPLGPAFAAPRDLAGSSRPLALVETSDGGFALLIKTYTGPGQPGGPIRDVLLRFDAAGAFVSRDAESAFLNGAPAGLAALDGGRVAIWEETEAPSAPYDTALRLTVIEADGSRTLSRQAVATSEAAQAPAIPTSRAVGVGDAVAAVTVTRGAPTAAGPTSDATLRLVGADGALRAETPFLDDRAGTLRLVPVALSDGRIAVFEWRDLDVDTHVPHVHLFEADGAFVATRTGPEVTADYGARGPALLQDVVATADGGLAAVFQSNDWDLGRARTDLVSWVFDANGDPAGSPRLVNGVVDDVQRLVEAAALADGSIVAVWEDRRDGDFRSRDVYAQRLVQAPDDVRFTGGRGPDREAGGAYDDRLVGRGGSDTLFGRAGEDVLIGGGGGDRLFGGPGGDRLLGRGGEDRLAGGGGGDSLRGHAGGDRLAGGGGPDDLRGGPGGDRLLGGGGGDALRGAGGGDVMRGAKGADLLVGGGGRDRLQGGGGADTLVGGPGRDVMAGGAGADEFRVDGLFGFDRVRDFDVDADVLGVVAGARRFADLGLRPAGEDLVVTVGGARMRLLDVAREDFGAEDVIFL